MEVKFDFGKALVPRQRLSSAGGERADGGPRDARHEQVEERPATHR
jgi:hypothetical protein